MDLAALFLTLAVTLLVGLVITRPLFERRAASEILIRPAAGQMESQRSALLAERDRALNALQDLDFDFTLGKIPANDYPQQRAVLLKAGADALRQLDELAGTQAGGRAEERVEGIVAARRADAVRRGQSTAPDELETEIAARRRVRQEKAAGFCPKCGRPVTSSDRFCSRCGATL